MSNTIVELSVKIYSFKRYCKINEALRTACRSTRKTDDTDITF